MLNGLLTLTFGAVYVAKEMVGFTGWELIPFV